MSLSHFFGTAVLLLNVIFTNGQQQFRQNMFGQRLPFGIQGRPFGMTQQFNRQGIPGMQPGLQQRFGGINIPPPPGFQRVTGQIRNQLPMQMQNALPNQFARQMPNQLLGQIPNQLQRQNALANQLPRQIQNALPRNPFAATAGVNQILNGAGGGFRDRFGLASGQELTRQLSPSPSVTGSFSDSSTGSAGNTQGQNTGSQRPQMPLNLPFGQQNIPGAVPMRQPTGPRNQPQDVMPRRVGQLDLSSIQPGQRFSNEPARTMTFPIQNIQAQPTNRFNTQNAFRPQAQQPPRPTTFGQQQTVPTQQTFGQSPTGTRFLDTVPQRRRFGAAGASLQNSGQTFGGRPTSLAFPQQSITQPIGVGRPASSVQVPQGAPQLLPGEIEIAPPISPDAAAAMQGSPGGGPPSAMSEIVTISDINGNILYRGVDLSDTEIERITQQLVNNMTDAQATEAARKGQELAAQGKLEPGSNTAVGGQNPRQASVGQQSVAQQPAQQPAQSSGGFPGQGFTSWGQQSQGLRFPGPGARRWVAPRAGR